MSIVKSTHFPLLCYQLFFFDLFFSLFHLHKKEATVVSMFHKMNLRKKARIFCNSHHLTGWESQIKLNKCGKIVYSLLQCEFSFSVQFTKWNADTGNAVTFVLSREFCWLSEMFSWILYDIIMIEMEMEIRIEFPSEKFFSATPLCLLH